MSLLERPHDDRTLDVLEASLADLGFTPKEKEGDDGEPYVVWEDSHSAENFANPDIPDTTEVEGETIGATSDVAVDPIKALADLLPTIKEVDGRSQVEMLDSVHLGLGDASLIMPRAEERAKREAA